MKKEIIISGLIFIVLFGCGEKKNISTSKKNDLTKDSLTAVIDSIRLANLHRNFVGKHAHPGSNRNLAVHAHQNIPKKVKIAKTRARRMERAKRIEKMRNETRKQALEKEGIINSED